LLALGIGDPIRFSIPLPIGQTDSCDPWHDVTRTIGRDALEPVERLCTATTLGLWSNAWVEHQESHRDDLTHDYADYAIYVWPSGALGNPTVALSNWTVTGILLPAYFAWMLHRGGQTLGQRLLRASVRSKTSVQVGVFRAALRSIIKSSPLLASVGADLVRMIDPRFSAEVDLIAASLLVLLPLTMAGAHRRGVHDHAAGTEVVLVDR